MPCLRIVAGSSIGGLRGTCLHGTCVHGGWRGNWLHVRCFWKTFPEVDASLPCVLRGEKQATVEWHCCLQAVPLLVWVRLCL
jgi:hypothetical protein